MDGVETIGVEVMWHTARTTDTRYHSYLVCGYPYLCHGLLECHADSVVATTWAEFYKLIAFILGRFHKLFVFWLI
jgi:hypothetical protein